MLEWPRLCEAVAGFAATAMGKEKMQSGSVSNLLTLPTTKEDSETLLLETRAGYEIDALCGGSFELQTIRTSTVKSCVEQVNKGVVVTGAHAVAVAGLLQCAQQLRKAVVTAVQDNKERLDVLQPIVDLVSPLLSRPDLIKSIWNVVDDEGTVKDSASPELRKARIQERALEQRLKEQLNKIGREKLGYDSGQQEVANVDGRLCIVVGSSSLNSVSGLVLRSDAGGYSSYVEPAAVVQLNDRLAEARAEVLKAEHNVLSGLTNKIRPYLDDIKFDLEVIVYFDIILARAKYSSWIGGTRPEFVDPSDLSSAEAETGSRKLLQLRKARHPLLLQQHRKSLQDARLKLKSKTRMVARMKSRSGVAAGSSLAEMEAGLSAAEAEVQALEASTPVPIDVVVCAQTRVVAITGPNTGGKTAAIKTVGLAALMAKAGLYVLGAEPVYLPWFDTVLADIGDEQSLSQSLSTFSGHLRRIQRIRLESTGRSLVLLDEVGAGTDPTEGSALGMALLESFAENATGGSLLTLATTHHGELKTLKYSDPRFENASVEFDEEKLMPTYRLIWGIPGRSNAINIAERLGLPESIIAEARSLHGAASAELNELILELEKSRRQYEEYLAESEKLRVECDKLSEELREATGRVQEQAASLRLEAQDKVASIAAEARSALSAAARNAPRNQVKSVAKNVAPQAPRTEVPAESKRAAVMVIAQQQQEVPIPKVGQLVQVPKLGRKVQVLKVNESRKEVTVQLGGLQMKIKASDILWPSNRNAAKK